MSENETTVAQQFASGSDPTISTTPDTIKGWNDRRKSNNQIISSMVPFVQLIGLFDAKEYEKMFATGSERVPLHWDTGEEAPYNEKYSIDPNTYNNIERQMKSRSINIYIVKSVEHGLNVDPIDGIIMAEKVSQVKEPGEGGDASGGIGITDLQVDYGKSNVLGSRKYNLRMTINDPAILDKRFEYSKLATFGGQFLLIYGWSNPQVIPGYDAPMSPPTLEIDPNSSAEPRRKRLIVPLRNLGNGGYWSAARVNISNYDFGFNEMGKMEINVTLRDDATLGMSSTVLSSVSKRIKEFIDGDLFGKVIRDHAGNEFTLRDELQKRQAALNKQYNERKGTEDEMTEAQYLDTWSENINAFGDLNDISLEIGPDDAAGTLPEWSAPATQEEVNKTHNEAREPQRGYPEKPALYSFKQVFKRVLDQNPSMTEEYGDDNETQADEEGLPASAGPTKQVISYEKQPVYYLLGSLMDAISMSVAEVKVGIGDSKVPSFYYNPISEDSKLSTSFQTNMESVNRKSNYEERIQEAVIRLKERFLPPSPVLMPMPEPPDDAVDDEGNKLGPVINDYLESWKAPEFNDASNAVRIAGSHWDRFIYRLKHQAAAKRGEVSGSAPIYFGLKTKERTSFINALFPTPPNAANMIFAPMRGHIITISKNNITDDGGNITHLHGVRLDSSNSTENPGIRADVFNNAGESWPFPEDTWRVYVPDWKREEISDTEGNIQYSLGSPNGFDPLNPTEYRAALPKRRAPGRGRSPMSRGFEKRSQAPYGRGGRFYMVVEFFDGEGDDRDTWINVVSYDSWRFANPEVWNLLQKKWHNLYIEYLGDYFEHIIRKRVAELESLAIPIEAIYNEPLDLDYLTGIVYYNEDWGAAASKQSQRDRFRNGLKSWSEVAGTFQDDNFNLESIVTKANQDLTIYEETLTESSMILNGHKGKATTYDEAMSQARSLNNKIRVQVNRINRIKEEIEELTGGKYDTGSNDIAGNPILVRFKPFLRIDASQTEIIENSTNALTKRNPFNSDDVRIGVEYAPIIIRNFSTQTPEVTEEWLLWKNYRVPTDNFQNIWYSTDEDNDGGGGFLDEPNKAQRWKDSNTYGYHMLQTFEIPSANRELDSKIREIEKLQQRLNEDYESFQEHTRSIEDSESKIRQIQARLQTTSDFFNEDNEAELGLYDDTSAFDTPYEADMSRDQPAILTTKVAQQWYRRFAGFSMRGVADVRNYGPPRGGCQYFLPSNHYQFAFDPARRRHGIIGTPRRVIDPGAIPNEVVDMDDVAQSIFFMNMLRYLDAGLNENPEVKVDNIDILSENQELKEIHQEGYRTPTKVYANWTAFGMPGIPNEEGNNAWGFRVGPPIDLEGGFTSGGNYVRTYKDFLNVVGLTYNPEWPLQLRVVGRWPMMRAPALHTKDRVRWVTDYSEEDAAMLKTYGPRGLALYTLMDEGGNIIIQSGSGGFRPTGWYLEFAGDPVYLYPSTETACKINSTGRYIDGVPPGHVLQTGYGSSALNAAYEQNLQQTKTDSGRDTDPWNDAKFRQPAFRKRDGKPMGRNKGFFQAAWDATVGLGQAWWSSITALLEGDLKGFIKGQAASGMFGPGIALVMMKRNQQLKKFNDGEPTDHQGVKGYSAFGGRIGRGAHCPNLTLDMKRSMIFFRLSTEDKTRFLPRSPGSWKAGELSEKPGGEPPDGPPNPKVDYNAIGKLAEEPFYRLKNAAKQVVANDETCPPIPYSNGYVDKDGNQTVAPNEWPAISRITEVAADQGVTIAGQNSIDRDVQVAVGKLLTTTQNMGTPRGRPSRPTFNNWRTYSNKDYPYGTGIYSNRIASDGAGDHIGKVHGPWQFPTRKKNWIDWGDFLYALGPENGYGFFTQVDNSNYTSCMVHAGGAVTDGLELNDGFVKFVIENVFAPLPQNRRCGAREDHKPIKIKGDDENDNVNAYNAEYRINDVTYLDLFGPLQSGSEGSGDVADAALDPAHFGNMDNFLINSVANIPIRADVVSNLLNKNNTNMSITQFIGEILRPGAIGINNKVNPQVAIRQDGDGTFEMLSLSDVEWDRMANNYAHLFSDNLGVDETLKRFPDDVMVFDFKAKDSLIENIDMNSKFDPLVARAFRDAAVEFTGNTDALINFLSYKDVAKDLKGYLETNYPDIAEDADGQKAIEINPETKKVTINKRMFLPQDDAPKGEIVTAISKFLQASPARLNNMRALMNANAAGQSTIEGGVADSNYATNLMANYMRKTTITVHGTTNLAPFQKVIIKGIMPNLEGMYVITNTRESITPQGFQTILEGTMIRPASDDARTDSTGKSTIPTEAQQPDVPKIKFSDNEDAEAAAEEE